MILIKSSISRKLLSHFFINPHETLCVNELARALQVDKRNLVKKLKEFESEGLLESKTFANLKLYSIRKTYPFYNELRKFVLKTAGVEAMLRRAIANMDGIKAAYIHGSYAGNSMQAHSDIDLLVIGDHSIVDLQKELTGIQREIKREVNCVHMSEEELLRRLQGGDPFLADVFSHQRIDLKPCDSKESISSGTPSRRFRSKPTSRTQKRT